MAREGEYFGLVTELEEAFQQEREAIEAMDEERAYGLLERIDGLLVQLVEVSRRVAPETALAALERMASLREGNAVLLHEKLQEMKEELSGVRKGKRAAAAYRPPEGELRGRAVDREA